MLITQRNSKSCSWFGMLFLIILITAANFSKGLAQTEADNSVRIGLMLSQNPEIDTPSMQSLFTTQYLVEKINDEGGIHGRLVKLFYKSGDGDWGVSSKRSVELIFDDEVSAIIGSLDGRNAHLTQMAITKAEVVYLETRSKDPTLSEINIPWFFRLIPNDKQQAEILAQTIFDEKGLYNILVIHSYDYDYRMSANTFNRLASETYRESIQTYELTDLSFNEPEPFTAILEKDEIKGVILFVSNKDLHKILALLDKINVSKPIFLPLTEKDLMIAAGYTSDVTYLCIQNGSQKMDPEFIESFKRKFNQTPGLIAGYSYDAINLILEMIKNGGTDRFHIRDQLKNMNHFQGVNGIIQFKKSGDIIPGTFVCEL